MFANYSLTIAVTLCANTNMQIFSEFDKTQINYTIR